MDELAMTLVVMESATLRVQGQSGPWHNAGHRRPGRAGNDSVCVARVRQECLVRSDLGYWCPVATERPSAWFLTTIGSSTS